MKNYLKRKTAVFIGTSFLMKRCISFSSNKFKKIYLISNDKSIKKIKKIKFHQLKKLKFDYLFSVLNDRLISEKILKNVKDYSINFHNGPLPKYAGLNSSTWAILNEEKTHGACWHQMAPRIDTGNIFLQKKFYIDKKMSAFEIDTISSLVGFDLFKKLITKLNQNKRITTYKQNLKKRSYFGKKDLKRILNYGFFDFDKKFELNFKIFRALSFRNKKKNFLLKTKILTNLGHFFIKKIFKIKILTKKKYKNRDIINQKKTYIIVKCRDEVVKIHIYPNLKKNRILKLLKINKKRLYKYIAQEF